MIPFGCPTNTVKPKCQKKSGKRSQENKVRIRKPSPNACPLLPIEGKQERKTALAHPGNEPSKNNEPNDNKGNR